MVVEIKKVAQSRFQRHTSILMWKSSLQRQRRWRILLADTLFASILFIAAVFIAKPVFLTPLQAEPEPPLTTSDILNSLNQDTVVGYAPDEAPYIVIMERVSQLLKISIMNAATEYELNNDLYRSSKLTMHMVHRPVMWVIWKPQKGNMWRFSIRSSERARYATDADVLSYPNPHLRAGFLALQLAVSQAILEHSSANPPQYEVGLLAMPVSPLMQQASVRKALSGILLCYTLALIPPVLETQALVVTETMNNFKRGLCMRGVGYASMYVGWLMYAYLTALPICFLAAFTLLLIFRWIHLLVALPMLLAYFTVMVMASLIMAMFQSKTWIACLWSTLFTLLQTYLAELVVHHEYDLQHKGLTFFLQVLLPPLGLVHALNKFALLQTGSNDEQNTLHGIISWIMLIFLYFGFLMVLQRTISQERAIGGQVSWKSIFFKKVEDVNALHEVENPSGHERDKLQEVDELVAKAVSFKNVSKSIMDVKVLDKVTLDIYRGEFTMIFAERVQERMVNTIEDLLTGLTFPDKGEINMLGHTMTPKKNFMTTAHMMGYCHRPFFLIQDLTVQEHFTVFNDICMWAESRLYILQYGQHRMERLMEECNLKQVRHELVRRLDDYYRGQLCWAIATLMEPRIVIVPNSLDQPSRYLRVVKDKIMQYKNYMTLIKMCFSSLQLENSDRAFIFDSKVLAFGGTPAYMFFKYGREYRFRMTIRSDGTVDDQAIKQLLNRASKAGSNVRAHLGSLLILRIPTHPTDVVAALVKDLIDNANHYGVTSLNISVPDSEEVYRRAMSESRAAVYGPPRSNEVTKAALMNYAEAPTWKRKTACCSNLHLTNIGWKYLTFHIHHKLYFLITLIAALIAGIFIGVSLSSMLTTSAQDEETHKLLHGEKLTIEFLEQRTILVLRTTNTSQATSLANAYALSEPNATERQIRYISYTALSHTELLTEYLITRAIDSPQIYVTMFAYGMDVWEQNDTIYVNALYSPLHKDEGAAARSMAKVFTALLRHYTDMLDASIEVTDDPLSLDLTPWMKHSNRPPLFLQFLLIMSIWHITLIPSMEYGLIRHVQKHAMNFSPARYWLTLYFWDLILYWILVALITVVMLLIMYLVVPAAHFQYGDLLVVPFMLIMYGFACVPQAYLFSLGPRVALNSMTFVIVNIVFGETTILAKLFYGDVLSIVLWLMSLSPQFNMAYAFVKLKQIFLYNSECVIFKTQNLCSSKTFHKCCDKCGVLQDCYKKRHYLTRYPGIIREVMAMMAIAVIFVTILLMLEYKVVGRTWKYLLKNWLKDPNMSEGSGRHLQPGAEREMQEVCAKWKQIKEKRKYKKHHQTFDTFGEYLLAHNLSRKEFGVYSIHSMYLGVAKGEVLAVSGLKRHGRLKLIELLAGIEPPNDGHTCCMSRWIETDPHLYARQIAISYEQGPLPPWMTVYDALELVALLRGVPKKHVENELKNVIEALELQNLADTLVCRITAKVDRNRLHFAAAVVGAPPILLLDEITAYQKYSVRRSMYFMLHVLRRRGHALFLSSSSVEPHMPVTNRLVILVDGTVYDMGTVDELVDRFSDKGFTVVVHLKDEVDVMTMFSRHFKNFAINDTTEVLVNVQIMDHELNWATMFEKMEYLKILNDQVYSYIITAIPIDYIYNSIISNEKGHINAASAFIRRFFSKKQAQTAKIQASEAMLDELLQFEQQYNITKLKVLPWSVIFHT